MAPLKLEDNIKEQFENRQIKPSTAAWDKLSDKLDKNSGSSKKGIGIWWTIAAGIAALAVVGTLLFSGDPSGQNNQIVVDEQQTETPQIDNTEQQKLPVQNDSSGEQVAVENKTPVQVDTEVVEKTSPGKVTKQQMVAKTAATVVNKKESVVITSPDSEKSEKNTAVANIELKEQKENTFQDKVDEVVGKIKDMETANAAVTEAEIAELLDQAQAELKTRSQINMETLTVDANALLMDVEYDLERSFRDKVFDALGDGYNKIRTAMATRNN